MRLQFTPITISLCFARRPSMCILDLKWFGLNDFQPLAIGGVDIPATGSMDQHLKPELQ
jgi:hypothetical protein